MQACGEKLFAVVNFYNKGSMSSMSITALFEVIALVITRYMFRTDIPITSSSLAQNTVFTSKHANFYLYCMALIYFH